MIFFRKNKANLKYILFEVTRQCNLNCIYCYNHWKRESFEPEKVEENYNLSLGTLKKLYQTTNVKHITFTGGEPLLAERLRELVLFCRLKGTSVTIITNGNAGTFEEFSQLIRIGVQLFELPVHSPTPSVHDRMTGVLGSWKKSTDTIRFITEMGGKVVPVLVITRFNFDKVGQTLEFIHSMGFHRIMLNRYNIGGRGVNNPEKVLPSKEQINEAFKQASETAQRLKLTISSNVCTPHCVIDPTQYLNIGFTNCSADITKRPLTLSNSGDLRFCNHSPNVLGNIFDQPVESILLNDKARSEFEKQPEFCHGCSKYAKCLGGCRAAAEQTGKTFGEVDPLAEMESKVKLIRTA
jgi:radical SAM protein with 4Fe4S-binding SPASM domain